MNTTDKPDCDAIHSIPALIAYTCAMESEAADRYQDLADQMEVHNNPEVAELFRKLSALSDQLKADYLNSGEGMELPQVAPWDYRFECIELLRTDNMDDIHYLMTPYHVVELALRCKKRQVEFLMNLSKTRDEEGITPVAQDFMQQQAKHISVLEQWLIEYPEPDKDWHEDHDPPTLQE